MPKFIFQLEGVLRHRRYVERQRQRDLAAVQAVVAELEIQLRRLDDSVRSVTEDMKKNHLVGRLDLNLLGAHRRYSIAMQRRAVALAQKIAAAQLQAQEAQKRLAEAAKQRKIFEKLREKRREQWIADANRRELMELDETAMRLSYRSGGYFAAHED